MFPVFATVRSAVQAAIAFAAARPLLLLCGLGAYAVGAAITILLLPLYHLNGFTGSHLTAWFGGLPALVLIAPLWTALPRFIILKERDRGYLPIDFRVWRMLLVTLVLSLITMIGGVPFAFSLDASAQLEGRRSMALLVLLGAAAWKLLMWWLSCRLAIAPPMAAAGARKQALDTAFSYTPGAVMRIMATKLSIYLPAFALVGALMLLGRAMDTDYVSRPWGVVLVTLLTALTEFTDAAAMAIIAMALIKLRSAAAAAAAPVAAE